MIREWAKASIYLDLLFTGGWLLVAMVLGPLLLIAALIRGDDEMVLPLLGTVAVAFLLLGFFSWMSRDLRKASKELRRQRKQSPPRSVEEGSDAAGLPQQPPWMG